MAIIPRVYAGRRGPAGGSGPTGPTGPQGPTGPTGPQGPVGPDIRTKGTVSTAGSLPGSGNTIGDAYLVTSFSPGHVFAWSGSAWVDWGPISGPAGATGPTGPAGANGANGATGATGATGPQGPAGIGIPAGGSTGQVLKKTSGSDYVTAWSDGGADSGGTADTTTVDTTNGLTGPSVQEALDALLARIQDLENRPSRWA